LLVAENRTWLPRAVKPAAFGGIIGIETGGSRIVPAEVPSVA
jgi:hypothetical protein